MEDGKCFLCHGRGWWRLDGESLWQLCEVCEPSTWQLIPEAGMPVVFVTDEWTGTERKTLETFFHSVSHSYRMSWYDQQGNVLRPFWHGSILMPSSFIKGRKAKLSAEHRTLPTGQVVWTYGFAWDESSRCWRPLPRHRWDGSKWVMPESWDADIGSTSMADSAEETELSLGYY